MPEPAARSISRRELLVSGALVLGPVLFAGCGGKAKAPAAELRGTFVGRVPGSEAFVGIDTWKDKLTAYVCDGRNGHISIDEWFHAPLTGGELRIDNPGGARLEIRAADPGVRGTVRLADGRRLGFAAHPTGRHEFFAHEKKQGRSRGSVIIGGESRGKPGAIPSGCWCQNVFGTWYLFCNAHAPYVAGKC